MVAFIAVLSTILATASAHVVRSDGGGNTNKLVARNTGELTYYVPGLGACGSTNSDSELVVALDRATYDEMKLPGTTGSVSQACNRKIQITHGDHKAIVTVVDRCVGCKRGDLDVSSTAFGQVMGGLTQGRVPGIEWTWA
jgi:expansin (peptidoglycan-binding protein)